MGVLIDHEDALEGSFLRVPGWDLADFYRDEMTLRGIWVRIKALPPDAPLFDALREEERESKRNQIERDIDDAVAIFSKGR